MALFSHRPQLQIVDMPQPFRAGESCEITVRVRCLRRVFVSELSVWLEGAEQVQFAMDSISRKKVGGASSSTIVLEGETLEPGDHEHKLRLKIPSSYSPSYQGKRCSTRYLLCVRLGLPFWPGRRLRQVATVVMGTPLAAYPGQALLFSSGSGEPEAKRGYLEGSLVSDVLTPGEFLRGAIALLNTKYNRYTRIRISLVGTESLHSQGRREEVEVRRLVLDIDTKDPAEGESFDLVMQIPRDLSPSVTTALWSLSWALEIVSSVRLGRDVTGRVPIVLVDRGFAPREIEERSAPRVGASRVLALWKRVSEKHEMLFDGERIIGQYEEVELMIRREHQGRSGIRVLATLAYPSLGLGIEVAQVSRLGSISGLSIGDKEWDRKHHIRGRSPSQMKVALERLASSLTEFEGVNLHDQQAQVWVAESGMKEHRLRAFVVSIDRLAHELSELRELIPLPSVFEEAATEWQQFAHTLGGALNRGDMSIDGQRLGVRVTVSHHWSPEGELCATEIQALGLSRLPAGDCFRYGAKEMIESLPDSVMSKERESLATCSSLPKRYQELDLGGNTLYCQEESLALLLLPTCDPALVERKTRALVACAHDRSLSGGPYR